MEYFWSIVDNMYKDTGRYLHEIESKIIEITGQPVGLELYNFLDLYIQKIWKDAYSQFRIDEDINSR